jgi:glycosyltransferase involved in cell wall biosynthesis
VTFAGESDDVRSALGRADVSVLTSVKEGCSNVVLESMAAGLPVVATDVGGNAELIEEGVTGFLVPAGDAEAVARRVGELLEDPGRARRMGAAGSARVRSLFTVQRMVDDTVGFYEEMLAERLPGLLEWVDAAAAREPGDA